MLNGYFRVQDYEVFTVNWGEDGVRVCQTIHPDLIILDIRLPDIDGYEVARRLRVDRRTQDIPIIFLTEKRASADILAGLEMGADDYITKPFDIQELRLRVRNALQRVRQGSLNNPVSGIPNGALVDERLSEILNKENKSLLLVSLCNLDVFRDLYGFVASDDVIRAVSLMIQDAMREIRNEADFLGHLTSSDFVLVTTSENSQALHKQVSRRFEQSLDYFYPIKDREQVKKSDGKLAVKVFEVASLTGQFKSIDDLKKELLRLIH